MEVRYPRRGKRNAHTVYAEHVALLHIHYEGSAGDVEFLATDFIMAIGKNLGTLIPQAAVSKVTF